MVKSKILYYSIDPALNVFFVIFSQGALATQLGVYMYVAVALALFCFLFTLLVFICLKDFKSNYIYNQINVQLCFCVALIVFISGSESYSKEVL